MTNYNNVAGFLVIVLTSAACSGAVVSMQDPVQDPVQTQDNRDSGQIEASATLDADIPTILDSGVPAALHADAAETSVPKLTTDVVCTRFATSYCLALEPKPAENCRAANVISCHATLDHSTGLALDSLLSCVNTWSSAIEVQRAGYPLDYQLLDQYCVQSVRTLIASSF